jgi:hypothetical protein
VQSTSTSARTASWLRSHLAVDAARRAGYSSPPLPRASDPAAGPEAEGLEGESPGREGAPPN